MTTTPTPLPALDRFPQSSAAPKLRHSPWLARSPVTRSPQRAIAGVCSGVAQRLGLSTAVVRVATVVLAILGPAVAIFSCRRLSGHVRG